MSEKTQTPVACHAPALTDELIARYKQLALEAPWPEVKGAMQELFVCLDAWWGLPESKRKDGRLFEMLHKGQMVEYRERPLERDHVQALWEICPWPSELKAYSNEQETGLFDKLEGELRTACFHVLWAVTELALDREPMTRAPLDALKE